MAKALNGGYIGHKMSKGAYTALPERRASAVHAS